VKNDFRNFIIFIFIGLLILFGVYFGSPYLQEQDSLKTSDAGSLKGVITVGVDNWVGYFPLCGKEMRKRLSSQGYGLKCIDDNANYLERFKLLKEGKIDFAVGTVDSYVLNGSSFDYPGSIVLVIDESKGGDAILAKKDFVSNLEDLKKHKQVRMAYTPDSPSAHLLKSVATHFDIPVLNDRSSDSIIKTEGSEEALKALLSGKADVAVLWEPDVSKALQDSSVIKLLGTENTSRLIVDILIASRNILRNDPEKVQVLLNSYFRTMKTYSDDLSLLQNELNSHLRLDHDEVRKMLEGVEWKNLTDNAFDWFGVSIGSELGYEGLIDAIESSIEISRASGDLRDNPLPESDAYRLINRQFIADLYSKYAQGQFGVHSSGKTARVSFSPLTSAQWRGLREVGTLKIRPVTFQSGTASLDTTGKQELDNLVANLAHYPGFRILIRGHTGLSGDPDENMTLSKDRAEAVARYLLITHDIDKDRVHAIGLGQAEPLSRLPNETTRSYRYRLPRVEIRLLGESF
jgi:outer membrane protein OmpA-like peptidoglycan-associated protein/ABC-type amino acid transport substrate-binding protein